MSDNANTLLDPWSTADQASTTAATTDPLGTVTSAEAASCDVSIGCSPGRIWETGVLDASVLSGGQPDEQS